MGRWVRSSLLDIQWRLWLCLRRKKEGGFMIEEQQNETAATRAGDHAPSRRHLLMGAVAGVSALALWRGESRAQTGALTSTDYLNFALNLEYVFNQYYRIGVYGIKSLEDYRIAGTGTAGKPVGGRQVSFPNGSTIAPVVTEMLFQQGGHIDMLRAMLTTKAVAQPSINIAGDESGAFTQFARFAGLVGPSEVFDPYESETNYLLGAFILGDIGQRIYRTVVVTVTDPVSLDPLCGLHGTHAYYSGMLREMLLRAAVDTPAIIDQVDKITAAYDALVGGAPVSQGIRPTTVNGAIVANDIPSDADGMVPARTPAQILNILYIKRGAATSGGFFPAGVNGTIQTSAA
jgi:Ferritin-like domain